MDIDEYYKILEVHRGASPENRGSFHFDSASRLVQALEPLQAQNPAQVL